jgi:uncharacterized transporter YbjL
MYTVFVMFIRSKSIPIIVSGLCLVALYANIAIAQTASGTQTTTITSTTSPAATTPPPIVTASTLTPAQQKRVTNLSANVSNKLDATTVRLTNIVLRMESRMRLMEQAGMDVRAAQIQIDAAKSELETIRVGLKNIDTEVARVTSSEKPQQEWIRVRNILTNTHTNLQQTKQILQSALDALKGAQPRSIPAPQTSTTTSSQ